MPDYKKMYLELFVAAEQAVETLVAAQRKCEALYMEYQEPVITLVKPEVEQEKTSE